MKNSQKSNKLIIKSSEDLIFISTVVWAFVIFGCGIAANWKGYAGLAVVSSIIGAIAHLFIFKYYFKSKAQD